MALTKTTRDHEEIKRWAEARGAVPAQVQGTGGSDEPGILRFMFRDAPGADDSSLEEISWDEFFEKFDKNGLELLYEEETAEGQPSNFNKLIYPESEAKPSRGRKTAGRKGAAKKAAGKKTPAKRAAAKKAQAKRGAAKKAVGRGGAAKKSAAKKTAAKKTAAKKGGRSAAAKKSSSMGGRSSASAKKSSGAKRAGGGKKSASSKKSSRR
jgi:hypothetical protein